jgi:hypothetical protein
VSESRLSPRRPASLVPCITGVRLTPVGGKATFVNISATGILVDCGSRLAPGSPVNVVFEGTFSPSSASGKVARCVVIGIDDQGMLRYHLGIAFNEKVKLEDLPTPASVEYETEVSLEGLTVDAADPVLYNRW